MKSAEGAPYRAAKQRQCVAPGVSPGLVDKKEISPEGATDSNLAPLRGYVSFSLSTPDWRPGLQIFAASQLFLLLLLLSGCANNQYRFERLDGDEAVSMPFQFNGITGRRDGASVSAEMSFANGADTAQINVLLELVPPAEFRSGTYRLNLGGRTVEGRVNCTSLDYLGGQNTQPSVGGVFVLTDEQNRPVYRVRVPATLMARKLEF